MLLAHKLIDDPCAALALDIAAPVKLAVAAFDQRSLELVVATAAAHERATVHALRGLIAETPLRAQRARAVVLHTVVWALLHIHQVVAGGRVEFGVHLHQLATCVNLHGHCAVILLFQCISHFAEVSQLQPAGL